MTQQMYSIKEASQELHVEAHVLRYWEEELGIFISRNTQGRRVYTESDLDTFKRVKGWKEQGLQLKAIKELIDKEKELQIAGHAAVQIMTQTAKQDNGSELFGGKLDRQCEQRQAQETAGVLPMQKSEEEAAEHLERRIIMYRPKEATNQENLEAVRTENLEKIEKAKRLQELLKQFITESIRESNTELLQSMKDGLLKELDYQFRLQEEREAERERVRSEKENEHFRELDENLRSAMEKKGRKRRRFVWGK